MLSESTRAEEGPPSREEGVPSGAEDTGSSVYRQVSNGVACEDPESDSVGLSVVPSAVLDVATAKERGMPLGGVLCRCAHGRFSTSLFFHLEY